MKQLMFKFIFFGIIVSSCSAQQIDEKQIPSVVVNAVKAKYPVSIDTDWKKVKNFYEAEIDLNDSLEVKMQVDPSGKVLAVKEDISNADLLPAIVAVVNEKYKGYTIDDAERIEKNGVISYQVDLDGKNKKDVHLVFSADGKQSTATYWH